jgi:hypothetical protein
MQTLSVLSSDLPSSRIGHIVAVSLVLLAGCARKPEGLTAYIPNGAVAAAYADLGQVRAMPLYSRLPVPEDLRDASAVLAVFDGRDWGLAVQRQSGITTTGIAAKQNGGTDLLSRAALDAPAWLVTRGSVTLPLAGNLSNINRLLHQAEYTAASARGSDIEATAECRTAEAARHLEENIRALASLARFEGLDVTSDGVTVRVRATIPKTP